jgi:hypothetical protein
VNAPAVEYEPQLVEAAVLRAIETSRHAADFRRGRDSLYTIEDPVRRESAFQAYHARWFARLRLAEPVLQVLAELPLLERVERCAVMTARTSLDEGAELFVAERPQGEQPGPKRSIVIRLRPELLLDAAALVALLRDELMHVADMLDPDFGYEPSLPSSDGDPTVRRLLLDRVHVLWNATVAGRLARREQLPTKSRERRYSEFIRAFSMLGDEAQDAFGRFFGGGPYRWGDLVSFALRPAASGKPVRTSCALCGSLLAASDSARAIAAQLKERIQRDFPEWQPPDAIYAQCTDLYRALEDATRRRPHSQPNP